MNTARVVCLALAALTLSTMAQAQDRATSGRIHFIGSIVEGACSAVPQRQALQVTCYRNGEKQTHQMVVPTSGDSRFMQSLGSVSQRTVPGHPELREVTISYF